MAMGSSTVDIKKKSKEIRVNANFSTGLNNAFKSYHNLLPGPEKVFAQLSRGRIFSKVDRSDAYPQT